MSASPYPARRDCLEKAIQRCARRDQTLAHGRRRCDRQRIVGYGKINQQRGGSLLFPSLQVLRIEEVFNGGGYDTQFAEKLARALKSRQDAGHPLERLHIRGAEGWTDNDVRSLQNVVKELIVETSADVHVVTEKKEVTRTWARKE